MRKVFILVLMALATRLNAQEVVRALRHALVTSNIQFVNGTGTATGTATSATIAYTCQPGSPYILIGVEDDTPSLTFSLTDTGGKAPGTNVFSQTSPTTVWVQRIDCTTTSNSITINGLASSTARIIAYEATGQTTTVDATAINNSGGATSCPVSATASQGGDLAFVFVYFGGGTLDSGSFYNTGGFNFRKESALNGATQPSNQIRAAAFDNLNAGSGTVSFANTYTGAGGSTCVMVLMKGIQAASPNFYPVMVQSHAACSSGSVPTVTLPHSVTSGNLLSVSVGSENTGNAPTCTDSFSATCTQRVAKTTSGGGNAIWKFTCPITSSGSDTITCSQTAPSFACVEAKEISGLAGTVPDTGGQTTSSGAMSWPQTVTNNNEFIDADCKTFHSAASVIWPGPYMATSSYGSGADSIGGSTARVVTAGSITINANFNLIDSNVCASLGLQ